MFCAGNKLVAIAIVVCSLLISACAHNNQRSATAKCPNAEVYSSLEFGGEIVRTMDVDGKACFRTLSNAVYCLSRTALKPVAITWDDFAVNDGMRFHKGLYLCAEQAGAMVDCGFLPQAVGWECDNYGSGPKQCKCTGTDACIAFGSVPTCEITRSAQVQSQTAQ